MIRVCRLGRNVRPGDVIDYGDGTFTVARFEAWIAPTGQSGRMARDVRGCGMAVRDAETVRVILPEDAPFAERLAVDAGANGVWTVSTDGTGPVPSDIRPHWAQPFRHPDSRPQPETPGPESPVSAFAGQRADTGLNARSGQDGHAEPLPAAGSHATE